MSTPSTTTEPFTPITFSNDAVSIPAVDPIATTGNAPADRLRVAAHCARLEASAFRTILQSGLTRAGALPIDPALLERDQTLLGFTRRALRRRTIPVAFRKTIERDMRDLEAALERKRQSYEALRAVAVGGEEA
jgi:hypothetical protein